LFFALTAVGNGSMRLLARYGWHFQFLDASRARDFLEKLIYWISIACEGLSEQVEYATTVGQKQKIESNGQTSPTSNPKEEW
jgi:hypothetical protein